MNRMYQWILKKGTALLLIVALLICSISAAMAASSGWEDGIREDYERRGGSVDSSAKRGGRKVRR